LMSFDRAFGITRSRKPSLLRSLMAMVRGCEPVVYGEPAAAVKAPAPLPRYTYSKLPAPLTNAKSGKLSWLKWPALIWYNNADEDAGTGVLALNPPEPLPSSKKTLELLAQVVTMSILPSILKSAASTQ